MFCENTKAPAGKQLGDILGARLATGTAAQERKSDDAIKFLKAFDPSGRHNLVAIDPSRETIQARTFGSGEWVAIATWIDERHGGMNLYYSVNEPCQGAPDKKLGKCDIGRIRALHLDMDPKGGPETFEAERERLRSVIRQLHADGLPPSFVVDSGNGFNVLWRLSDASSDSAAVERQCKALADRYGGDSGTHNIDRILRLPGTVNLPSARKHALGRCEAQAKLVGGDAGRTLSLLDATLACPVAPAHASQATDSNQEIASVQASIDMHFVGDAAEYAELPVDLRNRFDAARDRDSQLADLWAQGEDDKSRGRMKLAHRLHKAGGFTVDEYGALLWVWPHAIHGHENPDDKITPREIARAWANAKAGSKPKELDPADWFDPIANTPSHPAERGGVQSPGERRRFRLHSADEIIAEGLSQGARPLVKGLLDQGALSVCYGESNVGKTFVVLDLAWHIATGTNWARLRVTRAPVVYIAAEGGRGVSRRIQALHRKHPNAGKANLHLLRAPVNFRDSDEIESLASEVRAIGGAGLIVVDTLARALSGGDENASTDMGALVRSVDKLREMTGAHVMLIHHSGKDTSKGARGHSSLRAAVDTEIEVTEGTITVTKQRDMDGSFRRNFALAPVLLGEDADGDVITSCTVQFVSESELPPAAPSLTQQSILDAMVALERATGVRTFPLKDLLAQAKLSEPNIGAETLRSRLRAMEKSRLVKRSGAKWERKGGEISSTTPTKPDYPPGKGGEKAVE